jgi:hypothetical protein
MDEVARLPAMRQWGTPDPRDASAYPDTDAPLTQYAWQFLRRRPDYRKRWTQLQSSGLAESDGRVELWRSAEQVLREEFKVRSTFANETLDPHSNVPPAFDRMAAVEIIVRSRPTQLPKVGIEFDVTLPIRAQLVAARQLLQRRADRYRTTNDVPAWPSKRPRVEKLTPYLRLLDFEEAGASDQEIGAALNPNKSGESLRDVIRKQLDAAHKCQEQYLLLAWHSAG